MKVTFALTASGDLFDEWAHAERTLEMEALPARGDHIDLGIGGWSEEVTRVWFSLPSKQDERTSVEYLVEITALGIDDDMRETFTELQGEGWSVEFGKGLHA